ncbi:MAG: hypothetical protein ACKOCK_12530, partial [Chloroflexota bacterium]
STSFVRPGSDAALSSNRFRPTLRYLAICEKQRKITDDANLQHTGKTDGDFSVTTAHASWRLSAAHYSTMIVPTM